MLSRTCTSASFSDPINELSANTGSNDRDGADKGPVHTETAKIDAASTIIDKEATTNKGPINRETANTDPATTSVENDDSPNEGPVRTETPYIDAATSTNIDNENTTNKGLVHTQIANIDTVSEIIDNTDTSPANTSIVDIINAVNESMAKAANKAPSNTNGRRPWVQKLRKAGHFLIFG